MKHLISLIITFPLISFSQNVGVGLTNPQQKLDVAGGIRIGTSATGNSGAIRFQSGKFEGHDGTSWTAFTQLPMGTIVASATNPNTALTNAGFTYNSSAIISQAVSITTTTGTWLATSAINAPEERSGHSAVWIGNRMAVWGGYGDGNYLNTGGLYNPVTNTWTAMSASPLSVRTGCSMVWTGTEIIIWGGYNDGNFLGDGAKYNPASDTWTAMTNTGAPTGRQGHTALWTGTEMIIWGGYTASDETNTGARYNPATNTWTAMSLTNAPTARYLHGAVWTGSIMIVYGGFTVGSATDNGRYNPSTNTWNATPMAVPTAHRVSTAIVWTGTEMLVWGGSNSGGGFPATGERYNPTTNLWTPITNTGAPQGRFDHSYAWTGTELIVFGGNGAGSSQYTALNDGGRYNPSTNTWTPLSKKNAPVGRAVARAVWSGTMFIAWGGYNQSNVSLNTGGRYVVTSESGVQAEMQIPLYLFIKN